MKIYAYTTNETCGSQHIIAVKPGTEIGRDCVPVSRHGDYTPWVYGKRDTIRILSDLRPHHRPWKIAAAKSVATLLRWI